MAGDNPKCSFGDGVKILPDGINELSPHMFKVKQILHNVTVEILECERCGAISIGWYRQASTYEEQEE